MDFRILDIQVVAGVTATGLYLLEKDVKWVGKDKTYHCDRSAVRLKNKTPWNLTQPNEKTKSHSQYFHRMAMRTGHHQGVHL